MADSVQLLDEFEMIAKDSGGEVKREMASRTDGKKEGVIDVDRTGQDAVVRRSGTRAAPLNNLEDENTSVAALAVELNRRDGSAYRPVPKDTEDSDLPDVWLVDDQKEPKDAEARIGVQVTHLDTAAVRDLGRRERFDLSGDMRSIAQAAAGAIGKKQLVDPKIVAKTILLLICPYPIRTSMEDDLRRLIKEAVSGNRYRETWVAPFKERPFRVQ
jgi:hypothetical protein